MSSPSERRDHRQPRQQQQQQHHQQPYDSSAPLRFALPHETHPPNTIKDHIAEGTDLNKVQQRQLDATEKRLESYVNSLTRFMQEGCKTSVEAVEVVNVNLSTRVQALEYKCEQLEGLTHIVSGEIENIERKLRQRAVQPRRFGLVKKICSFVLLAMVLAACWILSLIWCGNHKDGFLDT